MKATPAPLPATFHATVSNTVVLLPLELVALVSESYVVVRGLLSLNFCVLSESLVTSPLHRHTNKQLQEKDHTQWIGWCNTTQIPLLDSIAVYWAEFREFIHTL